MILNLHHYFKPRYLRLIVRKVSFLLLVLLTAHLTAFSQASFTKGNLVVVQVGDGSAALGGTGTATFLKEYTASGTLVQNVSLPTTSGGGNKRLVLSGSSTSEGTLTRSVDFKYLTLVGYDAALATASISSSAAGTINRTVARVKFDGTIDLTTGLTDASTTSSPRAVVTTNGTDLWIAGGAGGVRYATLGATTSTQLSTTPTNIRVVNIFNNQLYITSASGVFLGVSTVGSGTPQTSGNTTTALSGFPTASGPSPYGFSISPDGNTIYVADDRTSANGGGIQKWVNNLGTWSLSYVIGTLSVRGLTVDWSGTNPVLYATTTETNANKIVKGVDTGVGSTVSVIATAASNTVFRGIAFAPYDDAAVVVPNLSINDVTITEGNSGTITMTFTVSLSSPAPVGGVTFDIATADNTATVANNDYVALSLTGQTFAQGESTKTFSVTINGDTDAESNETFFVNITNVTGANVSDGQGIGTITNDDVNCATPTLISTIQGTGSATTFSGTQVIRGIVVGDFQNTGGVTRLGGFYVQEEDTDQDANPATAEGIFVFEGSGVATVDVNVGDLVCVSGTVTEYASGGVSSLTQLTNPIISIVSSGNPLPTPVTVELPIANASDWERYESMRVVVKAASGNLAVTDNYTLGQYGQLTLSSGGGNNQTGTDARLDQYTQFNPPSTAGYAAHEAENAKRIIILDDGRSGSYPDPIIFGRGGNPLSASNTLRTGDEINEVAGVLDHRFEGYRIQTLTSPNFTATNARPATPPSLGASTLKVGSANILNYFNGNGSGGGFPTSRGADNLNEFNRQRAKIINGIVTGGADVVGLMELEEDGDGATSAIQDLINGLNAATASGTYDFVRSGDISTDQITVGIIYKPAAVELVGASAAIPLNYGTAAYVPVGRSSLAQTIRQKSNGAIFTLVVNHLKSKGSSSGGTGDADANDGQGFSNGTRTRQVQDLLSWLGTKPTGNTDPDYLLIGDFNAYAKEDPMTALATGGYTNLLSPTSYSYLFGGEFGSLDHALGSTTLTGQVTGAEKWHINSDEPTSLDYNIENKTTGQQSSLYASDVFRSSDHDPILIGLNLCVDPTIALSSAVGTNTQAVCATTAITPIAYAIGGGGTGATVTGLPDGVTGSFSAGIFTISGSPTTAVGSPFNYTVTTSGGCSPAVTATGTITVNPVHTLTLTSATATENQVLCLGNSLASITYTLGGGATNAKVTGLTDGVTSSLSGNVLTISGTPTNSGSSSYSITTSGNGCAVANGNGTIKVNTKPSVAISYAGVSLEEGKTIELCDTDSNPVNNLQFTVNTGCVSGLTFWRVQVGNGVWSDWSTSQPVSQASNNQVYRYQAACSDVTCTTTITGTYILAINYRASVPQNVSLVIDGTTVEAGETKSVCDIPATSTIDFNATCAAGEVVVYSVDGSDYSTTLPMQIVDGQNHSYRVRCRKADGTPSCVEAESAAMVVKISTAPAAPNVSITPTSSCGTPTAFSGTSTCGALTTVWYNAVTQQKIDNLPTTTPSITTSYFARCQNEVGCLSPVSNTVTFTITPVDAAPSVTVSAEVVCAGTDVTVSTSCPAGASVLWNTGVTEPSFTVSFANVTTQTYWARCVYPNGCQTPESERKSVLWKGFNLTFINIGSSRSGTKSENSLAAWSSQFVTPDAGPSLEKSTQVNPTLFFSENLNKTAPRYWTIYADACILGTSGSLTFDLLATPETGVPQSFNTHENNAPYFMYANRDGFTELYAQNHPAYGFYQEDGSGNNLYDAGLPKGLYKLSVRYWDMKGWGSIYPSTRKPQGNVLAYQEYWFRIQSKDGVGTGAAREGINVDPYGMTKGSFAQVMPNPITNVLRLKVNSSKGQRVNAVLTDLAGREVMQRSFVPETNTHQEEMVTHNLETGVYLLKVATSEKQQTLKVVKLP